jgi:hypothetical protein
MEGPEGKPTFDGWMLYWDTDESETFTEADVSSGLKFAIGDTWTVTSAKFVFFVAQWK